MSHEDVAFDAAWPDPAQPGVPAMPHTRDFHWINVGAETPILMVGDWCPLQRNWFFDGGISTPEDLAACFYLGPVITPVEYAAALRDAERRGARQEQGRAKDAFQRGWEAGLAAERPRRETPPDA